MRKKVLALLIVAVLGVAAWKGYEQIEVFSAEEMTEEGYPESLVELLERNPETRQFVMDYLTDAGKNVEIDLEDEVEKGTIPLFLQWDKRWGYETYGSDFLAVTGCGPTCLSMVACGLTGETKWDPLAVAHMAEEDGYYVEGAGSSWELMSEGAAKMGLSVENVIYDGEHIIEALKSGIPIICIMRPGDFTASGHFIVLTGVDDDGRVSVCDPNSKINSGKTWDVNDLLPQIKNLWGYSL